MKKKKIFDIVLVACCTSILFVTEQVLTFLPNIQITILLLVLYSKTLGTKKTLSIIFIHVILDNLIMASFNIIYVPFMMIGWMVIPFLSNSIFKKIESPIGLALLGILFAFLYSWIMIIPHVLINQVDLAVYFLADVPFELILAMSSFITILWLYPPLKKMMDNLLDSSNQSII